MHIIKKIPNVPSYEWNFIRFLRNVVKEGFISQHKISEEEHENFMKKNWNSYFIVWDETRSLPLGFVGVVDNDIRFAIDPYFQGKGIGTELLEFIREAFPKAIGKVKVDNISSNRAFEKAGYVVEKNEDFYIWRLE